MITIKRKNLIQLAAVTVLGCLSVLGLAAEPDRSYRFDIPEQALAQALRSFGQVSKLEIVFSESLVKGAKPVSLKGDFTADAALGKLLEGTGLVAKRAATGAIVIVAGPAASTSGGGAAGQMRVAAVDGAREGEPSKDEDKDSKEEDLIVTGSRIRQDSKSGVSPVTTYDAEYIRATGAMTLADFLNRIPQVYSGIAVGRGSAPNELNPQFGQNAEGVTPAANGFTGQRGTGLGQSGVSGVSLRGLGSASTLVLVDGRRVAQSGAGNRSTTTRQGFVDLNTISLGMIDRIDVITDGASAIYGSDAVAGVINIILRKDYSGAELRSGFKFSEHGGGRERNPSLVTGFHVGRLSSTLTFEHYDRQALGAADRDFSREENFTSRQIGVNPATGAPVYGNDFSLLSGSPAVIQAGSPGTFNSIPGVRVVGVPVGQTTTPAPAQFVPFLTPVPGASGTLPSTVQAAGQRRTNQADFLTLIPQSERNGVSANATYSIGAGLEAYANYRHSETRGIYPGPPAPVNVTLGAPGANVLVGYDPTFVDLSYRTVPAGANPFNQSVSINMLLPEFGSTAQRTATTANGVNGGLRGRLFDSWHWDLNGAWERQVLHQVNRQLNTNAHPASSPNPNTLLTLLTDANPALRYNPFIDQGAAGYPQTALIQSLAVYPTYDAVSKLTTAELSVDGDLFDLPGGAVKMAAGVTGSRSRMKTASYITGPGTTLRQPDTAGWQESRAVFAELQVPLVGSDNAMSLVRKFDLQLAGRHEEVETRAGSLTPNKASKAVPKVGLSWSPVESVLLRASYGRGFRAPGITESIQTPQDNYTVLNDPRRNQELAYLSPGLILGSSSDQDPEISETRFAGLVYEPSFFRGARLQVNYYDTEQRNILQQLDAQTIVNNEASLPGRVTRGPDTDPNDALPGPITQVDGSFVNLGLVRNRSLDYVVDYAIPGEALGRWRFGLSATTTLESIRDLTPGQPLIEQNGDTYAPPKWVYNASLFWNRGPWNASAFLWYLDGFKSDNAGGSTSANTTIARMFPVPSVTKVDLNGGYQFELDRGGLLGGFAKGLRVTAGISNLLDEEPPFSNNMFGYNAGLHSQLVLGRTYEFSFELSF